MCITYGGMAQGEEGEAAEKPLKRDEAPEAYKSERSDRHTHTVTFGIETGTCFGDLQKFTREKSVYFMK